MSGLPAPHCNAAGYFFWATLSRVELIPFWGFLFFSCFNWLKSTIICKYLKHGLSQHFLKQSNTAVGLKHLIWSPTLISKRNGKYLAFGQLCENERLLTQELKRLEIQLTKKKCNVLIFHWFLRYVLQFPFFEVVIRADAYIILEFLSLLGSD